MVMREINRFQIGLVDLNPTKGKEINKTKPCVVISRNKISPLSTVLVAPMTTKGFNFPCRVKCQFMDKKGLILLNQIRAVDKSQLMKNLGLLDDKTQIKLCDSLQKLFSY